MDDRDSISSRSDDDRVEHLIFFIHGVGGVCDVRFRSCVEVVADFKKMANNLLARQSNPPSSGESTPSLDKHLAKQLKKGFFRKHSTDSSQGSEAMSETTPKTPSEIPRRVECIPISWHSLTRRQTGMNEQLNLIALSSVPKLRHFLNKVVMDALLYTSGVHTQTIINNVGNEINRLYSLFIENHPNFTGSISLAGHSLGSVIVYDILAHQINPEDTVDIGQATNQTMKTGQCMVEYPQLKFKPRCFFAFGSPTPMFLNVRGIETISKEFKLPTCDRMFNIFHPYDPLAYRIEPLIDPRFKSVEPVMLAHHRGGKRIHVQLREGFAKVGQDIKHRLLGSIRNTWTSFTRFKAGSSPRSSRSPSVESTSCKSSSSSRSKRGKLSKSASSSQGIDIESLQGAMRKLPAHHFDWRRPLRRQELVRSQSEANSSTTCASPDKSTELDPRPDAETVAAAVAATAAVADAIPMPPSEAHGQTGTTTTTTAASATSTTTCKSHELAKTKDADVISAPNDSAAEEDIYNNNKENEADKNRKASRSMSVDFDTSTIGKLNGGRRIDYVLQEKPMELLNEYIFAFTSHANYWQNEDSALIILNEIYQTEGIQLFDHLYE